MPDIHHNVLFILGLGVCGGVFGAWLFQRLRVPQVIGYLVIGLLIGESGLHLLRQSDIQQLEAFNTFAMGIIGFMIGGELRWAEFKRRGSQYTAIMMGGGILSFLLVGLASGLILYSLAGWAPAIAGGCVFGAIAAATDPASTMDVLWENRAKGPFTTALTAVIILDAALAITLYGLSTGLAEMLFGGKGTALTEVLHAAGDLIGAVALGGIVALLLRMILHWLGQPERSLAVTLGALMLTIAAAGICQLDVILATMALGCGLINAAPARGETIIKQLRGFSMPVYVLFFVFVGAQLALGDMPGWLWAIVVLYVICRTGGKILGAWLGGRLTGSIPVVRTYTGFGLSAQGGVAIGLASMAARHFDGINLGDLNLGQAVIFTITATTMIVQVLGPSLVKFAVLRSGEAGRNVTREDVIRELRVKDVLERSAEPVQKGDSLEVVMKRFSAGSFLAYPVADAGGQLCGVISLRTIKEAITEPEIWQWLVAGDVMSRLPAKVEPDLPLQKLLNLLAEQNVDWLPVSYPDGCCAGLVRREYINKRLAEELVIRQGEAARGSDSSRISSRISGRL